MKKILLVVSFWLLFFVGQAFSLEIKTGFEADVISVSVDFSPLEIRENGTYSVVSSRGCEDSYTPERPQLPIKHLFLALPPNVLVKDIRIVTKQVQIEGEYNISLVSPPIPISENPKSEILNPKSFNGIFPESIATIDPIQRFRGYSLLPINVFAAQCDGKRLYWNKSVQIEITLKTQKILSTPEFFRGKTEDEKTLKGLIENQDILSSYKKLSTLHSPLSTFHQYIVITDQSLASSFQPLIDHKILKGLTAKIVTTQWIYEAYSGRDNQEKIRNFIKDYYTYYGTEYVLLGGDVEVVPYRGVYANVGDQIIDSNIPCDLYFSCLDGSWDKDNDNIFGELTDDVDLFPEVYVGRAPVNTTVEVETFIRKIFTYQEVLKELLIAWMADAESDCVDIKEDIATYTPTFYTIYKEYESKEGVSKARIIDYINQGVDLINHAGHANHWIVPPFEISDVGSLTNKDKPFIFYTLGCFPGKFEVSDSIGEHFITNPNGGAVAFIGNSRYGWYSRENVKKYSGEYDIEFFKKYFKEGYVHLGRVFHQSKVVFIPKSNSDDPYRWIMFCLNLLGDPEMKMEGSCANVLFGKVLRADNNEPINNATVRIILGEGSATTSPSGTYVLPLLNEGTYTIMAERDGCFSTTTTIYVKGPTTLDFYLIPSVIYSISGYVMTSQSVGIEDVEMNLVGITKKKAITNFSGYFEFISLISEDYALSPYKPNYIFTPSSKTYKPLNSNKYDQNFTSICHFYKVFPLYGTVKSIVDVAGNGFGANEVIQIDFGKTQTITTCRTNAIGEFSVKFEVDSQSVGTKIITARGLFSHLISTSSFCIIPPHSLSGYIKDASGNPIEGAEVILKGDKEGSYLTKPDGYYEFSGLLVGTYTIIPYLGTYSFSLESKTYTLLIQSYQNQNFYKIEDKDAIWPMEGFDRNRMRQSPYSGFAYPNKKWSYGVDYGMFNPPPPVIGYDGSIFYGNYALRKDGTLKFQWKGEARWVRVKCASAIGRDGTIYALGYEYDKTIGNWRHYVYAVAPDGLMKWKLPIGESNDISSSSPVLDKEGRIYVGGWDGIVYCINQDGEIIWKYDTKNGWIMKGLSIGEDGTIYCGSYGGSRYGRGALHAINPDGSLKWEYVLKSQILYSGPVIASNGTIYIGDIHCLYAIDSNGNMKWRFVVGGRVWSPAIGPDGTIYVAGESYFYALNPQGKVKWSFGDRAHSFSSSPIVDPSGRIYVGVSKRGEVNDNSHFFYCLDNNGTTLWRQEVLGDCPYISSCAISPEGYIYFCAGSSLYSLGPGGSYTLSGEIKTLPVFSDDKRIVEDVVLTISGPVSATTTTDNKGYYKFSNLPLGTYTLIPKKEGFWFSPASRTYIPLWNDTLNQDFQIHSDEPYSIWGNIRDIYGRALEDITLILSGDGSLTVKTDALGYYEFNGLKQGTYTITPKDIGYLFCPIERKFYNITLSQESQEFTAKSTDEAIWGQYQYDAGHRGRSHFQGPPLPIIDWATGTQIAGIPKFPSGIGTDGTVYTIFPDNYLWTVSPDGDVKWKYYVGYPPSSPPVLGRDGSILVVSSQTLHCILPFGTLSWRFSGDVYGIPVVGRDGTIYIGGGTRLLYAISPDGMEKWRLVGDPKSAFFVPYFSYPTIGGDDTIYFVARGVGETFLYGVRDIGGTYTILLKKLITTTSFSGADFLYPPAIGKDETIIVSGDRIYCLSPSGDLLWKSDIGGSSPAIAHDGTIYLTSGRTLYGISHLDGKEKYRFIAKDFPGSGFYCPPVVDAQGDVYLTNCGLVYAFTPDLRLKWYWDPWNSISYQFWAESYTSLVIGKDGKLFYPCYFYCPIGSKSPFVRLISLKPLANSISLKLSPDPFVIKISEWWTRNVSCEIRDENGNILEGIPVSLKTTIGEFYGNCFLPGYKTGRGTITAGAFYGEFWKASIPVIVEPDIRYLEKIEVSPLLARIKPGNVWLFEATAYDKYGNTFPDLMLDWEVEGQIGKIEGKKMQGLFTASMEPGMGRVIARSRYRDISGYADVIVSFENKPIISVYPSSGTIGSGVSFFIAGFAPQSTITIDFGTKNGIITGMTNNDGFFFATFTISLTTGGEKIITASSLSLFATSSFIILPSIQAIPNFGHPNSLIKIEGIGFLAYENITIDFGTYYTFTSAITGSQGTFTADFTTPNYPYGSTLITARGLYSAGTGFFIPKDKCFISGYIRNVTGESMEGIRVLIYGNINKNIYTDENGFYEFSNLPSGYSYNVSPKNLGEYICNPPVKTYNPLLMDMGFQNFTCWKEDSRVIRVEPTSGTFGCEVKVEGGVFYLYDKEVRIDFGTHYGIAYPKTDKNGIFSTNFKVEKQPPGTKTITATCLYYYATTSFFIIPEAKPSITIFKSSNRAKVIKGGTITYTITYTNVGLSTATDVVIIEVLPKDCGLLIADCGLKDVKISYWVNNAWQDVFSDEATKIKWFIPEVAPNQEGTVSFTVKVK
ncbi:TPA: hypothetical protein DCX16_04225 [bacterium]|nr:hypothetical protein [bacterium]